MKTKLIITTIFPLLIAHAAMAQNTPPAQPLPDAASPVVSPAAATPVQPVAAVPVQPPAAAPMQPQAQPPAAVPVQPTTAVPVQPVTAVPVQPATPAEAADAVPPAPKNEIRMNFQNASLTDVLNYLSSAAGFIIVQQTPVSGTVNVISKTPVTADEAVDLLDKVLATKGYTVLRDGRILNIVLRAGVEKNPNVKVITGNGYPVPIPKNEEVVTQIIPIRYLDATKIIENLRPLLDTSAIISVNESSNAILITDTQANIRRIAEIIHALDTSISSISTIKVYPLRYADAKEFSGVLTQLFAPDTSGSNGPGGGGLRAFFGGGRGGGGGGFGGGGGGEEGAASGAQSEARKAASRVVAVPDTQSNSVVVSAPDEYIQQIDQIVTDLDTSTTDITETKIFQLKNADSNAVSVILNSLYGDATTLSGSGANNRQGGRGGRGGGAQQQANAATQPSQRSLLQARMVAVPDPRTNSILVNCSPDTMLQVEQTIGTLDATDAKKQVVKVIALQHADPDTVVGILRTLFNDPTPTTTTNSALANRIITGASTDVTSTLNTNGTTNGGR